MELNITEFINTQNPQDLSASRAELGNFAGEITWNNAMEHAGEHSLVSTDAEIQEVKTYFESFGAWGDAEIAEWSNQEVNALIIQLIAGDIREGGGDRVYQGDDGDTYYYIGE